MSAPPGFNPNASLLPDPGASSAPIHVMRGGGQKGGAWTEAQLKILSEYALAPGQPLATKVTDDVKKAFLEQLPQCEGINAGIVDKKCWAVHQVVRAVLNHNVEDAVATPSVLGDEVEEEYERAAAEWRATNPAAATKANKEAAENAALVAELEAEVASEAPKPTVKPNVKSTGNANVNALIADIDDAIAKESGKPKQISVPAASSAEEPPSPNVPTPDTAETIANNSENPLSAIQPNYATATAPVEAPGPNTLASEAISANLEKATVVENNPKNFKGNRSGKSAKFRTNLTRKAGQRYYANFMVNEKPIRIRGNSPNSILKRYNYESQERPKAFQRTLRTYVEQQEAKKKQQYYINLTKAKQAASERQKKESEQSLKNIAAREAKEEQKHLENVVKQQQENLKRQKNEQKVALAESEQKLKAAKEAAKKAKPGLGARFKGLFKGGKSRRSRTLYRKTRKTRK